MIYSPQAILGVYDFLLSDEFNLSYIKKCSGSFKLYIGSEWVVEILKAQKKCIHPSYYVLHTLRGGVNKDLLKWIAFV